MSSLRAELEALAGREGARLFGVAPVDRFDGAPRGHHPLDFLPTARNVVAIAIPIPRAVMNFHLLLQNSAIISGDFRRDYLQKYYYGVAGYDIINTRLEQVLLSLTLLLEDRGQPAIYFPPTYGPHKDVQDQVPGQVGMFSMRHAAVRAGLGEFGLINVVVTPEYGPRVRFGALVTAAELAPSPLLAAKVCRGQSCRICIRECGTGALTAAEPLSLVGPEGLPVAETLTYRANPDSGQRGLDELIWYDPVSRTDKPVCRSKRDAAFCRGKCIRVCPAGQ